MDFQGCYKRKFNSTSGYWGSRMVFRRYEGIGTARYMEFAYVQGQESGEKDGKRDKKGENKGILAATSGKEGATSGTKQGHSTRMCSHGQ